MGAEVVDGARVAIIAVRFVGGMNALPVLAGIVGARIVIFAVRCHSAGTLPDDADVVDGARVFIVAGAGCRLVLAAALRKADVFGAGIAVIAFKAAVAEALPLVADIFDGAGVEVVAGRLIEGVDTAGLGITAIVGTDVTVVALQCTLAQAGSVAAEVTGGASITVVARLFVGDVDASRNGVTGIGGANVLVVAPQGPNPLAQAAGAEVGDGAEVAVVARHIVGNRDAAGARVTVVISANIAIVTG